MLVGQHVKILLVTVRFLNTKRAAVSHDSGLVPPCLSFPIHNTTCWELKSIVRTRQLSFWNTKLISVDNKTYVLVKTQLPWFARNILKCEVWQWANICSFVYVRKFVRQCLLFRIWISAFVWFQFTKRVSFVRLKLRTLIFRISRCWAVRVGWARTWLRRKAQLKWSIKSRHESWEKYHYFWRIQEVQNHWYANYR